MQFSTKTKNMPPAIRMHQMKLKLPILSSAARQNEHASNAVGSHLNHSSVVTHGHAKY